MNQSLDSEASLYPIGAVAALTGLSTNTIRAWERRYSAVSPSRSPGGGRRYSDSDVSRLQLLRAVTEAGVAIGAVAGLSDDELKRQLHRFDAEPVTPTPGTIRVAVVHPTLGETLAKHAAQSLDVLADVPSVPELTSGIPLEPTAHLLIIDIECLTGDAEASLEKAVEASGAEHVLVLYEFAKRSKLTRLAVLGARLVRQPASVETLLDVIRQQLATTDATRALRGGRAMEPRFTQHQLAQLALIQSGVECECPRHLATILNSLTAFERYSERCEQESVKDRELHRTLARGTAQARTVVEDLLEMVLVHDCIEVPPAR